MTIKIPGREALDIRAIVFDYNGTLATDGKLSDSVKVKLRELSKSYELYVLTADTYGSAARECEGLPVVLKTFDSEGASAFKAQIVKESNPAHCACVGNGFNDMDMFKEAALSVGVLGDEGIYAGLVQRSDILVNSIEDGLDLFLNTDRIRAVLRS
ncbi:MAG: ATPase P [Oscillospiraceae bacterium]|nr:ATPase P [Oscillospiraceae bacterium]